jgi:beta-lactamase regulating signal transducer with metallopeptidase domain
MNFVVEFIVKVTLIVACTGIVLWATRMRNAAARHNVWVSVVIFMLLLPFLLLWGPRAATHLPSFLLPQFQSIVRVSDGLHPAERVSQIHGESESARSGQNPQWNWLWLVVGVYLIGVFTLLSRLIVGTVAARRLAVRSQSQKEFLTSSSCVTPITLGLFRPVTILPEDWNDWSSQQLEMVLAHEREHARRHDPLFRWLALFNRSVFWFHPLSWWLERHLSFLAEQACDDAVLAGGHDPREYSEHLLEMQLAMNRSGKRIRLVGSAMPGSFLSKRIERVVECPPMFKASRMRVAFAIAVCLSLSGILTVAAIERPLIAQDAEAKWAGTWKFNKSKSNGLDPRIRSMLDSAESVTINLEPQPDGVKVRSVLIGINPDFRQQAEFALKFGVPTSGKEVSPILVVYPATVTMVPTSNNVLSLRISYLDGSGTQTLRFEVSSDGNTLTESLPPGTNSQLVFDREIGGRG